MTSHLTYCLALCTPQGRTVSFKNAMLVLTSNIGSRIIAGSSTGGLGAFMRGPDAFEAAAEASPAASSSRAWQAKEHSRSQQEREVDPNASYHNGRLREMVLEEVKQYFRPELLNRLDEQVVFHKLGRPEVRAIAGLLIQETTRRVEDKGFFLQLSQRMVERIITEGYSDEYGVRPLRQTVVRCAQAWEEGVTAAAVSVANVGGTSSR